MITGVERLAECQPGKRALAIRNVPSTLALFDTHFPRFPVLPGVIVIADVAEVAALFLRAETSRGWRLRFLEQVRWRHYVRPGDQMEIEVELISNAGDVSELSATVRVDGRAVTTIRRMRMVAV